MLESKIQSRIKKALKPFGWKVIRPIAISDSGYPDLWCLRKGKLVLVETKQPGEDLTPIQKHRKKELEQEGFRVIVAESENDVKELQSR